MAMAARRRPTGNATTSTTGKPRPRPKLNGRLALMVGAYGDVAWEVTISSGTLTASGASAPPIVTGTCCGVQLPDGGVPVVQIQFGTPQGPSTSEIANAVAALQNDLDSDNEISEMTSMQLQMLMDTRSKLLQTASDMMKAMAATDMAIVGNIKQ
jgi:hypothetical protein